jgi:hypothetical protein
MPGIHVNSCHDIVRNSFYVIIMISQERKSNRVLHDQSESFSTGFPWEIHEFLKKDRVDRYSSHGTLWFGRGR